VDDPRASAAEAARAVEEATGMLIAALRDRQQRIRDSWDSDDPSRGDTEDLRLAVLRYQSLFNRITEER
jgi:redox-regulated HSP33 family molecular chaperone